MCVCVCVRVRVTHYRSLIDVPPLVSNSCIGRTNNLSNSGQLMAVKTSSDKSLTNTETKHASD